MTRKSKQSRKRHVSRKRPSPPAVKTGPKKEISYKEHTNAISTMGAFIAKIQNKGK